MAVLGVGGLCIDGPGQRPLIRGVDLLLGSAEAVGLVGDSGAGKSLAASAMAGLTPPPAVVTAGEMTLAGQRLDMTKPEQWRGLRGGGVFLMLQSSAAALDPTMPVGRQVAEALAAAGQAKKQAKGQAGELLGRVGLEPSVAKAYPHQLSGGMRQRVQIAIALGLRPRALIADEPTTGLDAINQAEILRLLRLLNRQENTALLIISHDWRVVAAMADRVAVMAQGRIVEHGPTAQVMSRPNHPLTSQAMAALAELRRGDA